MALVMVLDLTIDTDFGGNNGRFFDCNCVTRNVVFGLYVDG